MDNAELYVSKYTGEEIEKKLDIVSYEAGENNVLCGDGTYKPIPQGEPGQNGADGKGISSIVKTETNGLVDTYTITFTDDTTTTFTVTNGKDGESNIEAIDEVLDATSENPVQNKAIYAAIGKKANINNPILEGIPKAPTAIAGTESEQIATTRFVATAIATAIAEEGGVKLSVIDNLPETGESGFIYLVENGGTNDNNVYDEYVWIGEKWELIGTTAVDLTGYLKESELIPITTEEIDVMFSS